MNDTTRTCYYCGALAIKQFKYQRIDNKIVKPGVWCCSNYSSQCPVVKQENIATNKARDTVWLETRKQTSLDRYGAEHYLKVDTNKKFGSANIFATAEFKDVMEANYGVSNAAQLPGVGAKISSTKQAKTKDEKDAIILKLRETNERSGVWCNSSDIPNLVLYRRKVIHKTEQVYMANHNIINPLSLPRGVSRYHIDHIFSIRDAFLNEVPIDVVSHISNLRMLWCVDNIQKNRTSHKTLDQLYYDVSNFRLPTK